MEFTTLMLKIFFFSISLVRFIGICCDTKNGLVEFPDMFAALRLNSNSNLNVGLELVSSGEGHPIGLPLPPQLPNIRPEFRYPSPDLYPVLKSAFVSFSYYLEFVQRVSALSALVRGHFRFIWKAGCLI